MARFHTRTGALVTLSNENKTALRNHPAQEFNNGVVLSAEPLRDNQLFEVKIDKKVFHFFLTFFIFNIFKFTIAMLLLLL